MHHHRDWRCEAAGFQQERKEHASHGPRLGKLLCCCRRLDASGRCPSPGGRVDGFSEPLLLLLSLQGETDDSSSSCGERNLGGTFEQLFGGYMVVLGNVAGMFVGSCRCGLVSRSHRFRGWRIECAFLRTWEVHFESWWVLWVLWLLWLLWLVMMVVVVVLNDEDVVNVDATGRRSRLVRDARSSDVILICACHPVAISWNTVVGALDFPSVAALDSSFCHSIHPSVIRYSFVVRRLSDR